jgi:hypothetical protein
MTNIKIAFHKTGGIRINGEDTSFAHRSFTAHLARLGIEHQVEAKDDSAGQSIRFHLRATAWHELTPGYDTLQLCAKLNLHPLADSADLEQEIVLAMLAAPVTFEFPSYAELTTSIRMRQHIAEAARRTALSFHTTKIERPADYWTYTEGRGFTILPGKSLIAAMRKATQPSAHEPHYSFSCYRASEYVMLIGIAEELANVNPPLLQQLQRHWEADAIQSRQFHDIFMREYGSMEMPLPMRYYVPGDRLWFRNPDEYSSDVSGFEGSWVIYLGNGLFTNFWKSEQPFTLSSKCIEIYHWRNGVIVDAQGELKMDESIVERLVRETLRNPAELAHILDLMLRLRDPSGVYAEGGCIDSTREYPRWVCLGTTDIELPVAAGKPVNPTDSPLSVAATR